MTAISWTVSSMQSYPQSQGLADVVFNVNFVLTGSDVVGDVTYTSAIHNSAAVALDVEAYGPYADLTEEQVIGWVKDALGADRVAYFEANVTQQVADQISPPVVTLPLPWVTGA